MDTDAARSQEHVAMGVVLKELRQASGVSLAEAAQQLGQSIGDLEAVENGHRRISLIALRHLCALYGASLPALVETLEARGISGASVSGANNANGRGT